MTNLPKMVVLHLTVGARRWPKRGDDTVDQLGRPEPEPEYTCPEHGPYWPLFGVSGPEGVQTMCPVHLSDALLDGRVLPLDMTEDGRWASNPHPNVAVAELVKAAELMSEERRAYDRVLRVLNLIHRAAIRANTDSLVEELTERAGGSLPVYLTAEEVASLLRVTPKTVIRQAGHGLPASMQVGKKHLFRTTVILAHIDQMVGKRPSVAQFRQREADSDAIREARKHRDARQAALTQLPVRRIA